jgi:large subunit ribosomal protein L35
VADRRSSDKMKTHRGAAKRFRRTGKGGLKHRHAYRSHNLEHKSAARRRRLRATGFVDGSDQERVRRLLPYPESGR